VADSLAGRLIGSLDELAGSLADWLTRWLADLLTCWLFCRRIIDAMSAEGSATPLVGVIMGSKSDYVVMRAAVEVLREFGVPHEARIVSAHRTPERMFAYADSAASRGLRVIIAGAGGAAHLPGMVAAKTVVPVLGVPIAATALQGFDALLSIVQMPKGVPVGTLAIGAAGAANAALLAVQMLATTDASLRSRLVVWRSARRDEVLAQTLEDPEHGGLEASA
jgi:5-(carboxyamino)imidazole ribonucleotide mutase